MTIALRRTIALAAACAVACCIAAPRARADSLHVSGHAGFIGEWQLAANLTESGAKGQREFSGPLALKHVGLCTHDGPEEKAGRMQLTLSASSSRLTATLFLQDMECTYSAKKSAGYDGVLICPGQSPIPLSLQLN